MADKQPSFKESLLSEQELSDFNFVKKRIKELQDARKEEQYGVELEDIWLEADRDYTPHRIGFEGRKRRFEQDEDKGWRGTSSIVKVGQSDWQSDISQPNPFVKIQIALSILIDQNPSGVFTAASKKFTATTELVRQLYQRSWDYAKSKQQLKLFTFNLAKYGWACARTYPLRVTRKVKNLVEFDQENPDKSKYEEKEVVEYNDIMRENLDPWNVWMDDMARPHNERSLRDWSWRKVYSMESAEEEFGKWKNWKYVKSGGVVTAKLDQDGKISKTYAEENLVEAYFYENKVKDLFTVILNGVPVVISPLPISDSKGHKKLSLWQAYWNLRNTECPYGIGIYEAIRFNQRLLDRVENMSIDQLTLSIYKMFFYQGTNQLTETGDIKIAPGVGKQTLDPKNINFLEIPGPGREAVEWKAILRQELDEASGITDPLLGVITGKTAFEIAQAKESALKRLKTPLENITDALDQEAYITISLIQLLYSIPEVYKISDPELINSYLNEVQSDPELYSRDEEGNFEARVFPEIALNLEEDKEGNLVETNDTQFFRIKPRFLQWEGIVNVDSQSVLTPSKQVDKALDLEMYNMLIPLLVQDPMVYGKIAKALTKLYDKDPKDILPDSWLMKPEEIQTLQQQNEPLIIPAEQIEQIEQAQGNVPPETPSRSASQAQTLVSSTQAPEKPQSLVGRISSKLTAPFR